MCGGSYGAGNYAMCGKAYDPRFLFAWPTTRHTVMGGDVAAGTLTDIKVKQLEREGQHLDQPGLAALRESVRASYEEQADPRYGAARLWTDGIIDPAQTREVLMLALEAASLNPIVREFKTGVLQT
jgi:acetyl-CoA carboxylase carboxyltransferase component